MNIRNILRVYGLLRNFSDGETALLETLRSLTDSDREQMVETLAPAKVAVRKRKSRAKSQRAESLATAIQGRTKPAPEPRCVFPMSDGIPCTDGRHSPIHKENFGNGYHPFQSANSEPLCIACGNVADYADHSQPSPHYHPFATSSTAQPARSQSSRSGQQQEPAASSVTRAADVGDAQAASAGGD